MTTGKDTHISLLLELSADSFSIHGHDKSIEIRKYSSLPNRPTMFYAGDGVSDLSAAKETDLLFAKADMGAYNAITSCTLAQC
jgi:2-hydroxy-3-keto-5-methylthiopentenyl-1-phosphate phosphatase